jgi:hypothetical protein
LTVNYLKALKTKSKFKKLLLQSRLRVVGMLLGEEVGEDEVVGLGLEVVRGIC